MLLDRRSLLALGAIAVGPAAGRAQPAIPDKAVRLLIGFGTGGGLDQVARLIAPQLERRTGRHIVIEARSGDTGASVGEMLRNGPNDGSYLALMPSTTVAAPLGNKAAPFDPLVDILPITLVASFPLALAVSPRIGVETFQEYVEWLKGGDAERARLGTAALSDAFLQLFGKMLGRDLGPEMKMVGFRNASALITDLESGRVPAAVAAVPTLLTGHRGGRLRILLVTGAKRVKVAPKLPTGLELGLQGFELREWYGFFAGGKTPEAAVNAWNKHMRDVLDDNGLKGELTQLGLDVETSTPEEARERIATQMEFWKTRMQTFGVKLKE